jgi:hypothetical protein
MPPTDAEIQAALDKPGAGLPFHQWAYLRFYLAPFVAARSDWDENWRVFEDVNARILAKIGGLSGEQLEKRVLVPPLAGLEDSSRYWSVALTLEHLIIVGEDVKKLIIALARGAVPPGKAGVADYKPKGGKRAAAQVAEYKDFVASVKPAIEPLRAAALASKARYLHPWAGPFTARQWQWLLGGHTHIHYRQIKEIIKGLELSGAKTPP